MSVFALVDCNNFYVSCERVFNPKLEGRPVIVLSNNDGCAVARSNEVKALDIKMGSPVFRLQDIIKKHGIHVFSSNYALYGDMSRRVVSALSEFASDIEVYSIDESFLDLSDLKGSGLSVFGKTIKQTVEKNTGIPVSVGIGQTKTLAKLAARIAKKSAKAAGVLDLTDEKFHKRALEITDVEDVWGVGRRYAKFLRVYGINNARELRDTNKEFIRNKMGINGVRLIEELRGKSCYPLDRNPSQKKGITVSRTFGRAVEKYDELEEAVTTYACRGAEKLRKDGMVADVITVFLMTSRFQLDHFYYNTEIVRLPASTNNSAEIIKASLVGLDKIYKEGGRYKKAGIFLKELRPEAMVQRFMFDTVDRDRAGKLMNSLDRINNIMGRDMLKYASAGLTGKQKWRTAFNHRSQGYTTRWDQLPTVR